MKLLREIFLKDWRYKLTALIIAVALWSVVNLGKRTAITVSRYVDIRGERPEFVYRVKPERVDITVYVVERLLFSKMIEEVRAYVNVSDIDRPGTYRLKVFTETKVPIFIHPASVDPPVVRVVIRSAAAE